VNSPIDPLKNLRRWAALTKDMIKIKGFAARVSKAAKLPLSDTMLLRILTENLEQQREPNSYIKPFIFKVAEEWNYKPEVDYSKAK
jgi:hypothetical protein